MQIKSKVKREFSEEHRRKISESRRGKKMSEYTRNKIGAAKMGDKNHNWKGNSANYFAKHQWIRNNFGMPTQCERCGEHFSGRKIQWANISGKYLRERIDWKRLCAKCHVIFDGRNKRNHNKRNAKGQFIKITKK